MRARSRDRRDLAAPLHAHEPALPAEDVRRFHVGRDADAHDLAATARRRLLSTEPLIVRQLHDAIEGARVVARVVGGAERGPVGKRVGRDEIAPANLDGIEIRRVRGLVHEALDQIDADRPARSSIGTGRRRVRVNPDAQQLGVLDPVGPEDVSRRRHRRHQR